MNGKTTTRKAATATGDAISQKLRQYYDSLTEETIPDRFLDLLEQLDEADKASSTQQRSGEKADDR